jgi:hypothetical protein
MPDRNFASPGPRKLSRLATCQPPALEPTTLTATRAVPMSRQDDLSIASAHARNCVLDLEPDLDASAVRPVDFDFAPHGLC